MKTIQEFFDHYNTDPDQIYIQLIDDNDLEIYNFERLSGQNYTHDGAVFFYKTTTGSYYRRIFSKSINVKWFGAKGDGTNDDTLSIQKTFDYLFDHREHNICSVFIPNGNYRVTSMLKFPSQCELQGEDKRSTQIFSDDNNYDLLYIFENLNFVPPNNNESIYWTLIKNISIRGKHRDANVFGWFPEDITSNQSNSGIVFNSLSRTYLEHIIIEGFETCGVHYNTSYYHRFNHLYSRKNKIGLLATSCTSIHGINSEFRLNSLGHSFHSTYSCSFIHCLLESNFGQLMINRIDYNSSPGNRNGVAVYLNNSFNNTYSNCYFEAHVCTFYFINSNSNLINNSFICAGTNYNFTNLDGNAGFFNNSKANILEKNFYFNNIDSKAKYYLSANSTNNFFGFFDENTFNNFIEKLDSISNFTDKSLAPSAICPSYNKIFYNGKVSNYYQPGSSQGLLRPLASSVNIGFQFFDTSINKPIWSDGLNWRDSDGTIV